MRFTSPSRRALGLLAASAIGMSTTVLGVAGVASAAPVVITDDDSVLASTFDGDASLTIPAGYCYASVQLTGASGGGQDSNSQSGGDPESIEFYLPVQAGQVYTFAPGGAGESQNGPVVDGPGGVNTVAPSLNGTAGTAAGGGGAGTALLLDGAIVGTARGGDGAAGSPGTVAGVGGGTSAVSVPLLTGRTPVVETADVVGAEGTASIQAIGCNAPSAPHVDGTVVGDGQVTVDVTGFDGGEYDADPSGYEYSLDGTTWVALTPAEAAAGSFTVTGLTNGTSYPITVRATSESNGTSEASDPSEVTPYDGIGAVTGLAVTRGVSSVTVTWNPPTEAGTYPLAGYDVGWSGGEFGSQACALDTTVRTCFISFPAGTDYLITAYAIDSQGNLGDPARIQTGVIAAPAVPTSVPTKDDGDITGTAGPITSLTAGQKVTLVGSGFAPDSTVQLTVFSAPVSLGTVVTDGAGAFSVEVTLPANLANGTHTLVATGINPDGTTRNLVITVTVSGGVATLANTGFDTAVPLTGGAIALLAGAGMLVGARRRTV